MSSASIGCSLCAWITTSTSPIGQREIELEAEWIAHAATSEHVQRLATSAPITDRLLEDGVIALLADGDDGDEIEWRKL